MSTKAALAADNLNLIYRANLILNRISGVCATPNTRRKEEQKMNFVISLLCPDDVILCLNHAGEAFKNLTSCGSIEKAEDVMGMLEPNMVYTIKQCSRQDVLDAANAGEAWPIQYGWVLPENPNV